jgi:hypothetical protein
VENRTGTVSPGNGIGQLEILGRFANGEDGILEFELGGVAAGTQYDQLIVAGGIALDGTLDVSLVNLGGGTFAPTVGNSFTLIAATEEISGAFDTLQVPDGLNWQVIYNPASVELIVGNPGDFNHDGIVDAADYVVWRRNGWGPLNFQAWKSHFGQSYGRGAGRPSGVPEPSGLLLMLVACGFAQAHRALIRPVRSAGLTRR